MLTNPYANSKETKSKIYLRLRKADYLVLQIVSVGHNDFVTHAIYHWINHLADVCRQNNWNVNDTDKLTQYITQCTHGAAADRDDGRTTGQVGSGTKSEAHGHAVGPEAPSTAPKKQKGKSTVGN